MNKGAIALCCIFAIVTIVSFRIKDRDFCLGINDWDGIKAGIRQKCIYELSPILWISQDIRPEN
jgi:hypothetical protein